MYLLVLSSGLFQDGDFRIGILPELQEIVVGKLGVRPIIGHHVCPRQLKARHRADRIADHDSAMIQNSLELGHRFHSAVRRKIGFASDIARI